jgi:hypothetical protein
VEEKLTRIPFSREEEQTIDSMARWMRFMAVVGIVGAILMLFAVAVGIGLLSVARGMGEAGPKWAERQKVLDELGPLLYPLLAAFLLAAVAALWQNFALHHAGEDFSRMASTDEADLDYLADGLDKLRMYFKIQVLVAVIAVAVAFGAALALAAVLRQAS